MKRPAKRQYRAVRRAQTSADTRERILAAAKRRFSRQGIDQVPLGEIARDADVAESTIYALFKSREGLLRELMRRAIFNARYHSAAARLEDVRDPVEQLRVTAAIARTIYDGEAAEIGLLRGASAFSAQLKKLEREFESARLSLQRQRVERLHDAGKLAPHLDVESARQVLWMYTSRDIYRMLVIESGWSPERYEQWLAHTLVTALTTARRRARR